MPDSSEKTLISVIIPAYNSAAYLEEAIRTVFEQTYDCLEIIVIDDGSTDNTSELLRKFDGKLKYLHQTNRGPSSARNIGIRTAKGRYICFLDSDDTWKPEKLELQLGFMESNPDVGLVFSDEEEADSEKLISSSLLAKSVFYAEIVSQQRVNDAFKKLLIENFIPTSAVMVRRECFERAGLFDESLPVSEDRDMWSRLAAHFKIGCLPLVLGKKRTHQRNISSEAELTLRSRIKVWEKAHRYYPELAPPSLVNSLLANAYLQLGYILLSLDQRKEARKAGFKSVTYFARNLGKGDMLTGLDRLVKGVTLIPLSFLGWRLTQSLLQVRSILFRRARHP